MKVQLGPYSYDVEFERSHNSAAQTWGHIKYEEHVIRVDDNIKMERQRVCLMHEVLHGVFELVGHNPDNEEQLITAISPALLEALRRNKEMTEFLLNEEA